MGVSTSATTVTVLRLRQDASVTDLGGSLSIQCQTGATELADPSPGLRAAVWALAGGDVPELELAGLVTSLDGEMAVLKLHMLLRRLDRGGWLEHAVLADGEALVRLRPTGSEGRPEGRTVPPDSPVKLSRLAVVQAEEGQLVLRAPESGFALVLGAAAAPLLAALADWTTPEALPVPARGVDLLAAAGVLVTGGVDHEREDRALAAWSPPDLWLHARSRGSRLSAGYGGTYALAARFDPLPVTRPAWPGHRVELVAPDLELAAKNDPPLTGVLERRRSVREHGVEPITVDQVGELLYRVMRQRQTFVADDGMELADRPYPSGGAVHELEIYPLVTACRGLEPGLWHYHVADHALDWVAEPSPHTARIAAAAQSASLLPELPQVVLVVAARFGRVQWKYETIAYSLVLKHVGVLYQTVYLVATAMRLAVCGLGGGDAGDFAAATGLPYHEEGSVGELVLGSAPDGHLDRARAAVAGDPQGRS